MSDFTLPQTASSALLCSPGCLVAPASVNLCDLEQSRSLDAIRVNGDTYIGPFEAPWTAGQVVSAIIAADKSCRLVAGPSPLDLSGLDGLGGGEALTFFDPDNPCGSLRVKATLTATSGDNPVLEANGNDLSIRYNGASGTSDMRYEFGYAVDVTIEFRSNHNRQEPLTLITPYSSVVPGPESTFQSGSNTVDDPHVWSNNNNGEPTAFTWLGVTSIDLGITGTGLTQGQRITVSNYYECDGCQPAVLTPDECALSIPKAFGHFEVMYSGDPDFTAYPMVNVDRCPVLVTHEIDKIGKPAVRVFSADGDTEFEAKGDGFYGDDFMLLVLGACPVNAYQSANAGGSPLPQTLVRV